ncbi:uncharacterized protein LOC131158669 [Malania oleifera]|uniref:uncharacterized protein LOC131158669 n=1 Tax=Malania oleifera TaxID=397392 RepID=UPI0025AE5230|nr:uncharacterized protein LOC131158669 [Malania oleifera]
MEEDGDSPPFWSQPTRRHRSSFPILSPTLLIVLFSVVASLFFLFAVPPFISFFTTQIFRPHAVKKSWDSLNVLLVLLAILCGIFFRKNEDESVAEQDSDNGKTEASAPSRTEGSLSHRWYDQYSDERIYDAPVSNSPVTGVGRLRRSSSSYPDLRQESLWGTGLRFFDDSDVNRSRSRPLDSVRSRRRRRDIDGEEYSGEVKVIPVDTFELRATRSPAIVASPQPVAPKSPAPPHSPPPPPPPPPPAMSRKQKRTYQTHARKEKEKETYTNICHDFEKTQPSPPPPPRPPPPPPPPPPMPMSHRSEQSYGKHTRKKGGAKKEIASVIASLYNQRKRKKKSKPKNEYDNLFHPQTSSTDLRPPPSAPPPPPPPPPPSVFNNLFRRGIKSKRVHSVSAPPPPPAPPRPQPPQRKSRISPPPSPPMPPLPPEYRRRQLTRRPTFPARMNSFYDGDENGSDSGQSPLIPMPPPPPPPPFRMAEPKFVVRGDFIRIRSGHNSRCGSPELDDVELSSGKQPNVMSGGDSSGSGFCSSPDVNVKAATFIARHRDGWRLEKIQSMKEKQRMGFDPGPDIAAGPGPIPGQI